MDSVKGPRVFSRSSSFAELPHTPSPPPSTALNKMSVLTIDRCWGPSEREIERWFDTEPDLKPISPESEEPGIPLDEWLHSQSFLGSPSFLSLPAPSGRGKYLGSGSFPRLEPSSLSSFSTSSRSHSTRSDSMSPSTSSTSSSKRLTTVTIKGGRPYGGSYR